MAKEWLDKATGIRKGEELDVKSLEAFLLEELPETSGPLSIDQFPGGASNLTYLIRLGDQQLVLRRPPFGSKVKSAHDMGREYKVLHALSKSYKKAPKPLVYTENIEVIGAPFYVMERIEGVIIRNSMGMAKDLPQETIRKIAVGLIETFAELHAVDYQAIGLGELGRPAGYTERQITGWTKRYRNAKTEEVAEAESVFKWLAENMPKSEHTSLIHNDYKHDNVILDAHDLSQVNGILDWEMSTLGDPLMDLGTTLAYWYNPGDPEFMKIYPSALPGNPTRSELVQLYAEKSGRDVGQVVFYFAYGLFKLAGVIQQIYYRYHHGHTQDQRFAQMNVFAANLLKLAARVIEKKRIDDLF